MYTTVTGIDEAVSAAADLVGAQPHTVTPASVTELLPLLVDQTVAEAGVAEPLLAARALVQARGDIARAVSLIRAWVATVPRLAVSRVSTDELAAERRITPAFLSPSGGQYLGASLDYAQRLLRITDDNIPLPRPTTVGSDATPASPAELPTLSRALLGLEAEGVVAMPDPPAVATDITREVADTFTGRGAFQQLLSRAETGTLTAMAYTAQRGYAQRQDPTLAELRTGTLPVTVNHPLCGVPVEIGRVPATVAEIVFYRMHDGTADARFTLGFGATLGLLERRAIAGAMLDAGCARAAGETAEERAPVDDQEFLALVLDGQEAAGFVDHLKLPHYVSFTSDLDRVRRARAGGDTIADDAEVAP